MWKKQHCSCSCNISLLCLFIIALVASASTDGNPANKIVDFINENRTSNKLPKLYNSPGLGCMAPQYISECTGNCSSNNTLSCKPSEDDITEVYAPNCGVELPTVSIVSGHLVGCHWKYLNPDEAFSSILISNKETLSLLHGKEHTEVGVGFSRAHRGPSFWCVFFSSGETNSSFVLEGGSGIKQRTGCFSGIDLPCSAAKTIIFVTDSISFVLTMLLCFVIEDLFG